MKSLHARPEANSSCSCAIKGRGGRVMVSDVHKRNSRLSEDRLKGSNARDVRSDVVHDCSTTMQAYSRIPMQLCSAVPQPL